MIGVILSGRLGNQLFQYAFAYSSAKKLGVKFYLEPTSNLDPYLLSKYFEVNKDAFNFIENRLFLIKGLKRAFNKFISKKFYSLIRKVLRLKYIELSIEENPISELAKVKNSHLYFGYYQSECYFVDFKDEIINQFTIRKKYKIEFNNIFNKINTPQKKVVIHIRRTDYLNHNYDLPIAYFHKAISIVDSPENFYIFISDDPEFVELKFGMLKNKYISKNPEIIDFQFLMAADVCILSNSSFSWWGAYLNPYKPKIFAPKYWLGIHEKTELPFRVIPQSWSIIDI